MRFWISLGRKGPAVRWWQLIHGQTGRPLFGQMTRIQGITDDVVPASLVRLEHRRRIVYGSTLSRSAKLGG